MKPFISILFMLNAIIFVLSRKGISYEVLYNNKYFDDYFMLFPTRSGIECRTKCFQEKTCRYFSFNRKEQLCMLHSIEIYIAKQAYTTNENWNIYGPTEKVTKWGQLIFSFVAESGIHPLKSFKDGSFEREMLQIPGNYRSTAIDEWHLMKITELYVVIHMDGYLFLELYFKIPTSTSNTAWFPSNYIQGYVDDKFAMDGANERSFVGWQGHPDRCTNNAVWLLVKSRQGLNDCGFEGTDGLYPFIRLYEFGGQENFLEGDTFSIYVR